MTPQLAPLRCGFPVTPGKGAEFQARYAAISPWACV